MRGNPPRVRLWLAAVLTVAATAPGSSQGPSGDCPHEWDRTTGGGRHCETREYTLPSTGVPLEIDARPNGGIRVTGQPRADVLVRARIMAAAAAGRAVPFVRAVT